MDLTDTIDVVPDTLFIAIKEDDSVTEARTLPPPETPPTQIVDIQADIDRGTDFWSVITPSHGLPVIQEDDNGGEGPSNPSSQEDPTSQTLTLPTYELSSDSDNEGEEVSSSFTPHQPPEETALERRLREVAVELDSDLDENPFAPFNHPPGPRLQAAQRRNHDWARAHPLSRDDRIRVDLMSKLGFTDSEIVSEFKEQGMTIHQVRYARVQTELTPRSSRNQSTRLLLRTAHRKKIID